MPLTQVGLGAMTQRFPCWCVVLITSAACTPRPPSTEALLAELARDTSIIHSPGGWPSDSAVERLLDRLGVPFNRRLATVDTACALNGHYRMSDSADTPALTRPRTERVTCRMRE